MKKSDSKLSRPELEHRIAYLTTIYIHLRVQFNLNILESKTAATSAMAVEDCLANMTAVTLQLLQRQVL